MEAKRQEIERKREIAYQKELKGKKQRERQEREGEKPAASGMKRLKDKPKKKGGMERIGDGKLPLRERTDEEKKLEKIPSIKKKVHQLAAKTIAPSTSAQGEKKKRKPLAQIMSGVQGVRREKPVVSQEGMKKVSDKINRIDNK